MAGRGGSGRVDCVISVHAVAVTYRVEQRLTEFDRVNRLGLGIECMSGERILTMRSRYNDFFQRL